MTEKRYADATGGDHGKSVLYDYTPDGRPATRTWSRQIQGAALTTTYGYDDVTGELTMIDYRDDTPDVMLAYNRFGGLASVDDAAGHREFTYTDAMQPPSEMFVRDRQPICQRRFRRDCSDARQAREA